MSRNVRNKFPRPPAKVTKRRGSDSSTTSLNLSDDDGYSAVEDISDSEDDDEENVYAAEEKHIITHESRGRHSKGAPRPQDVGNQQNDDDDEENDDDDDEVDDADVDDEENDSEDEEDDDDGQEEEDDDESLAEVEVDDNASWDGIVSDTTGSSTSGASAQPVTTPVRHVRFADVPSSDSDDTETEDDHADFFPDLFVDQSSLDPAFRREIEGDEDESSNSSAFWDYHGPLYEAGQYGDDDSDLDAEAAAARRQAGGDDDTPTATPMASQVSTAVSTPVPVYEDLQDLDGYESDGDTTEEDIPEPVVRRKTSRPGLSAESSDSEHHRMVKFRPGKPRLGNFDLNSSDRKPIAVVNPISRKMMIFTPYLRHQLDLSPEQFNLHFWNKLDEQSSPILSNSGSLMMGAMFSSHTFGDFMNSQPMGPAEAFFPALLTDATTTHGETSDEVVEEDEDEAERSLDISDFITWEEGGSSDEADADDEDMNGGGGGGDWADGLPSSPLQRRGTTASSDGEVLAHLNSDTVGAFRRNQINQQLIYSNKATQDSLAFSAPYNLTALRGLKSDRFQTAHAPLTPMRRQKRGVPHDLARSPLEAVSQKRKASAAVHEAPGHKRQRSISDVNMLRI